MSILIKQPQFNRVPNTVLAAERLLDVVAQRHGHAAFIARVLNALANLAEHMDETSLTDAAGAPSDYSALVQVLEQPQALAVLRKLDPLSGARVRGLRALEWLLSQEGGFLSGAEIAGSLGITRQAVDKRRKRNALIGLNLGRRGYAYPAWQIGDAGTLNGLERVMTTLGPDEPWTQFVFFLTKNIWLDGETPIALLRRNEVERVVSAARLLGEQVAA